MEEENIKKSTMDLDTISLLVVGILVLFGAVLVIVFDLIEIENSTIIIWFGLLLVIISSFILILNVLGVFPITEDEKGIIIKF